MAAAASTGSSCSQILTASQPAAASSVSVSRSRRAIPRNFKRHQLVLVLGRWAGCSGQECQKQPSTNTAIRAPRNRTSARRRRLQPGTGRSTTNLKPRRCRALRNANSGPVPDRLVRRITNEVAGDDAGGTGPGSRCLYTAQASRDGPTAPCRGPGAQGLPRACLMPPGRRDALRRPAQDGPAAPGVLRACAPGRLGRRSRQASGASYAVKRWRPYNGDLDAAQVSIILTLGCAQSPKAAASFSLTCSLVSVSARSMKHWQRSASTGAQHQPVTLAIGPVLHPDDAVANKVCALFSRAQARDYIDVDAVLQSGRYTSDELLALAQSHDPGFDVAVFVIALRAIQPPTDCRVHALRPDRRRCLRAHRADDAVGGHHRELISRAARHTSQAGDVRCHLRRGSGKPRLRYPGARFAKDDPSTGVCTSW